MSRDEQIGVHVSSSLKRDIEELSGTTPVSKYVRKLLKQHVVEMNAKEIDREASAEEKIEKVAQRATDEIAAEVEEFRKTAKAIQSLTARGAFYGVASWEVVKQGESQTMRNDARSTASRRLRKDIIEDLELEIDPEEIEDIEDEQSEKTSSKPWEDK